MGEAHIVCFGCGAKVVGLQGDPTDVAPSLHCGDCPPWICDDCHEPCSATAPCPCWTSLEGLPLADLKALFALGDLSLASPPGDAS